MTAAGLPAGGPLSIGAVLARLKPEFPDVTISKIRFLESEGLVEPGRSPAGYRQFGAADVERLRFVLAAQRDHYLPLKVIKEQLDAIDRGMEPGTPVARLPRSLAVADGVPAPEVSHGGEVRMTRVELLAHSGLTTEQLRELVDFGLLEETSSGWYDDAVAEAARTIAELLSAGLEPRHLRTLRTAADREAQLVGQLVAAQARRSDPDAKERAGAAASSLASVVLKVHAQLLRMALRRELGR